MKKHAIWALGLVTVALSGCGEGSARTAAAPSPVVAAVPSPSCGVLAAAPIATIASPAPAASLPAPASLPAGGLAGTAKVAPEVSGSVAPARPASAHAKAAPPSASAALVKLSVKRLVVAEGVKAREPLGAATTFSGKAAKKIYAFVELENGDRVPGEITVSFEPPGGGASRGNVTLAVGAEPRFRTWAFTRAARVAGAWTAVVKDGRGEVLARAPFEVSL